ncbi:MAG TPA: hypothetical protein VIA18_28215, partial [Polyangia bacterium]|nr:hypothetical protein [Polyangia bacterium]
MVVPGGWTSQNYQDAGDPWNVKAPPIQLPLYGVPPPQLASAYAGALAQLEQGSFFSASYIADAMLRDDRVSSKSEERIDRVVGATVDLEPGKDTARGEKVVADFGKIQSKLIPPYQLAELMRFGIWLSVGIAQITPSSLDSTSPPTFRVWNNRYIRFDWLLRKYCVVTENKGEIALQFVNGVDYSDGAWTANGPDEQPTRWIVFEPYGPLGWLHGAKIRTLTTPYLIRTWVRTWWARYCEVHGMPIRAGIIPAERKPADERLFLSQLTNLAHEAVIRLPQGEDGNKFDVKLIEAASNSWQGFEK